MRNLALGQLLLAGDEADHVVYAICAPKGHTSAWRRTHELRTAFPDTERRTIRSLSTEAVKRHHVDGGAALSELYRGLV
jgi:hypothetical protein